MIDLCKLFGVEEGEEFNINEDIDFIYRVHNNKLQYLYDYEKKIWHKASDPINNFVEDFKITKLPKKKEFTDDELCILRNINKEYKWLCRDKCGDLTLYVVKPVKSNYYWDNDSMCVLDVHILLPCLFQSIQWEDEEPVYIPDYVERGVE